MGKKNTLEANMAKVKKKSVKSEWVRGCSLPKSGCFCECLKYFSTQGLIEKHLPYHLLEF